MAIRDNNGKFTKRADNDEDKKVDPKEVSNCDDKLQIIQAQLYAAQHQLEIWQREFVTCDHKDRDNVSQLVSHYSWRVSDWHDQLIRYLDECNCRSNTPK